MAINFLGPDGVSHLVLSLMNKLNGSFAKKTDIPTTLPADGGNADTVGGHTVAIDVPANAKFTDTIYTHPANHPASMITEDTTHRFVSDAEQTKYEAAYTHSQAAHAPTNAERNTVVGIQKNGTDVAVDSTTRKVNIAVPTKVSELSNDSGFQTAAQVSASIAAANHLSRKKVDSLSSVEKPEENVIYMVLKDTPGTNNIYDEWQFLEGKWELMGNTAVDMSGVITEDDLVPITNAQIDEIMAAT